MQWTRVTAHVHTTLLYMPIWNANNKVDNISGISTLLKDNNTQSERVKLF